MLMDGLTAKFRLAVTLGLTATVGLTATASEKSPALATDTNESTLYPAGRVTGVTMGGLTPDADDSAMVR